MHLIDQQEVKRQALKRRAEEAKVAAPYVLEENFKPPLRCCVLILMLNMLRWIAIVKLTGTRTRTWGMLKFQVSFQYFHKTCSSSSSQKNFTNNSFSSSDSVAKQG